MMEQRNRQKKSPVVTATDDKAGTDALANKKVTVELKATLQKTIV